MALTELMTYLYNGHISDKAAFPAGSCYTLRRVCCKLQVTRDKNVIKPAKGTRQCNCRNKVVTRQLGPGMFQQYTTQECEQCGNLQYVRQIETLTVSVEAGTPDGHVRPSFGTDTSLAQSPSLPFESLRGEHISTPSELSHDFCLKMTNSRRSASAWRLRPTCKSKGAKNLQLSEKYVSCHHIYSYDAFGRLSQFLRKGSH